MNPRALGFAAFLLGAWELLVRVLDVQEYLLPPPSKVAQAMWEKRDYLLENTPATLIEIWVGFGIAIAVGILLAVPVALTRFGEQAVMPALVALQNVPKAALAPVFLVWFGYGLTPKIVIAALLAFFPVVVNTSRGLRAVEPEMVQYMTTLGASRREITMRLRLPTSLPYLFASAKVAISLATVGAIVGEFLGAKEGLGHVIFRALNNFETPTMFAALVLTSAIGVASYGLVNLAERWFLRWQPDDLAIQSSA